LYQVINSLNEVIGLDKELTTLLSDKGRDSRDENCSVQAQPPSF